MAGVGRYTSWWTPATRDLLTKRQAALVWADRGSRQITPLWRTADWGYVRLPAGRATPQPRYGRQALSSWTERVLTAYADPDDVFLYPNNDPGAAAVTDARALRSRFDRAGRTVMHPATDADPRTPGADRVRSAR